MFITYALLILGFFLLIKGADFFVDGSSSVAKILHVPSVIIGLTIVAFGTSAPEASVSISAGINGSNAIAVGNVIGSNIFNTLVVVGACAAFKKVTTNKDISDRDFPINIAASVILILMLVDGKISRIEGFALLAMIILYVIMLILSALKNRTNDDVAVLSPIKSIIYILGGLVAIIAGGKFVVSSSIDIARAWHVSEGVIALTIIALGTSLPELVTSLVATSKGEYGLALGNVVGSNIFNILFILGISSAISPIVMNSAEIFTTIIDGIIALFVAILMFIFCKTGKKINRIEGIICLLLYIAYVSYLFVR